MTVTILNSLEWNINETPLAQAAQRALCAEGADQSEVTIVLTDDEALHELNLEYRGQDKSTDVLSFAQRDSLPGERNVRSSGGGEGELLGDVVISVETAARQAPTHGMTLEEELNLLVVHGILHLLGYDDVTEVGADEMCRRERVLGVRLDEPERAPR